jgi:two-component system response regulator HydG
MGLYDKLKTMRVLLIDDDEWIRSSLECFFKNKASAFHACESAELALEQLKHEVYDIILCDYRLPQMNGITFFKILKKLCPHAIKILITAYYDVEIAAETVKMGVHDFIQKPLTTEHLVECLTRLIQNHEGKPLNEELISFGKKITQ